MREEGFYGSYEGDDRPTGQQKHPVQLNPIAYLPMPDLTGENSPVEKAWQNRYELTAEAKKPITLGWTFGEFALASVRMRDPHAFAKDLSTLQLCRGADPRWIQMYESSFWTGWHLMKSYYLPMMGLWLQSYTDMLVQDWRRTIDLFACLMPEWKDKDIAFHGIHTKGGVEVDGRWSAGKFTITLTPAGGKEARVMVSQESTISVSGQKNDIDSFEGFKEVTLEFDGEKPIILEGKLL